MLRGFITDDESSLSLMINVQTVHKYTIKESLSVCDCNWNFGRCFYADDFIADFSLTVLTHNWRAHMHGMRIIPNDHFANDQFIQDATKQSESSITALMKFKHFGFGSCREKVTGRSHLFFLLCVICVFMFSQKIFENNTIATECIASLFTQSYFLPGPAVLCSQEGKILLGSNAKKLSPINFFSNLVTDASLCCMNPHGIPGTAQASLAL